MNTSGKYFSQYNSVILMKILLPLYLWFVTQLEVLLFYVHCNTYCLILAT
jgi:hypothetical protein